MSLHKGCFESCWCKWISLLCIIETSHTTTTTILYLLRLCSAATYTTGTTNFYLEVSTVLRPWSRPIVSNAELADEAGPVRYRALCHRPIIGLIVLKSKA